MRELVEYGVGAVTVAALIACAWAVVVWRFGRDCCPHDCGGDES